MKRASARLFLSVMVVVGLSAALLQPAIARPRSWFLPSVSVDCVTGDGPTELFTGSMELNATVLQRDELTVGGSLTGSCGDRSINTFFRTSVVVNDASCDEVSLTVGDIIDKDTLIELSEDPVVIAAEDGGNNLRGALCAVAATESGPLQALAKALDRLLALQG